MRLSISSRFVPVMVFSCCVAPLVAQTDSAPGGQRPDYTFKTNANAVVVDVVVTKGNDEPVPALHKQDFLVLEDGKPQTIDFFEEHTAKTLPPGAVPPLPKMPPDVYTNVPPVPESDSVNVLLLDSLNTERQDQVYVHKQILEFLKNMKPGTRAAIFTLGSKLRFVQGFTTDSSLLLAALNDKKNGFFTQTNPSFRSRSDVADDQRDIAMRITMFGGHFDPGIAAIADSQRDFAEFQYGQRTMMTLEALNYLARYLADVPGRKNLIWFASSFPVIIFPSSAQSQTMSEARIYASAVKKTADLMTVSRVAVYPVAAEGMMNDHWMEADSAGSGRASGSLMREVSGENSARADEIEAMKQLADDTGGKAFYNTNDLNAAMQRAIDDGSHYYTLVYSPTNKKMDGKYRRIEVKLTAGKYKLAYRRGYNADDTATAEAKPESDPLKPLLKFGLPGVTQLLYGVRVVPASPQPGPNAARAGKNPKLAGPVTRYNVDFMIRWTDVAFVQTQGGMHSGKIQLGLMAYDRDGHAVNWAGGAQGMNLDPDVYAGIQKSGIPAHMEIDLPNADVYLETGVYDWGTSQAGTLEIPIHFVPTTAAATAPQTAPSKN
ncbi:MAG TPA: VWA domain-containing protein [Terracidiphilus sp.]|nr:VWA domain-containing protein [Terracidiphilus sp.]